MASTDRIHGSSGSVSMDPTGGTSVVALASISKWSLDMSKDKVDVTSFGDTNKVYVIGLPDIKGAFGGFWDKSAQGLAIFDAAIGTIAVYLNLIPSTLFPTYLWKGLAYLDAKIDVDAKGAVTIGGSFVAAGPWSRTP